MNNTDYFFQVGDVRYPVKRERTGTSSSNYRYYLYYYEDTDGDGTEDDGETRHYLNVDGTVVSEPNTRPANGVTERNGQLFSGILVHYRRQQRIDALKDAVKEFIAVIDKNDQYDKAGNIRVDDEGNPKRLGNRISIVTFASADNITVVNSLENGELGNGVAEALEAKVDSMRLYSGTRQDEGIKEANNQFTLYVDDARKEEAARTVVLFTDGEPYAENTSTNTLYDNGVKAAQVSKKTHEAT